MALPFKRRTALPDDAAAQAVAARDRDWVERIRVGDAAALEAVFRVYADPLYAYAMRYLRSRERSEEIVHDLFLNIWARRDSLELARTLKSYLYQATRNRAISQMRHARVEQSVRDRVALGEDESTLRATPALADEEVRVGELRDAITDAVDALPTRCREVFLLSREQQLTYAEIAEVLHLSVKTVEIHMGRALLRLRASLCAWND